MKNYFKNTRALTLWASAGTLLGLSFWSVWTWWLGFFGVWLCLEAIKKTRNVKELLVGTLLMGFLHFALVIIWFWNVYPINDYQISPSLQLLAIFISWSLPALSLAAGKLTLTLPLYFFRLRYPLLIVPMLWLISDVVGAFLFSILTFGSGATVNANFSFGWLGYLLAEHGGLLWLAGIGGVFGLTFVYVFVAYGLQSLWQNQTEKKFFYILVALIFATTWLPLSQREYESEPKVAMVDTHQTSILWLEGSDLLAYQTDLFTQVERYLTDDYEYIILPEGADFTRFFDSPDSVLSFLKELSTNDVVLVDSSWYEQSETESFLRARIYDTKTKQVYEQDKMYLVPQGEFMPYLFVFIMNSTGFGEAADIFRTAFNYVPGELKRGEDWPDYLPGVLYCSESVSPWAVKSASDGGTVPFVAHIVSHAWFHEPTIMWHQLDQIMLVNSRFGGETVYQASNMYEARRY